MSSDIYTSKDCDGDGVLDHICENGNDGRMWMVLSSEGCSDSWQGNREKSECPAAFGIIKIMQSFPNNFFFSLRILPDNLYLEFYFFSK